jgi:predicted nucleic acid-binding protein
MIVVDTNIIAYLYLESDRSSQADQLLGNDSQWSAPLLWRSEFRNVLALYIRKSHLSLDEAQQIMREAMVLMNGREFEIVSFHVLELVASSGCSAYDCEFVTLAEDLGTSLVTIDKKVLNEFPQVAVSLDEFITS